MLQQGANYYQRDGAGAKAKAEAAPSPRHRHGTLGSVKSEAEGDEYSRRPLTFWPLLALIFYVASGGPFGIEPIVGSVGPLLSVLGYLVFPLVWSVPEGLMTAELSSAFPECAGSVAWVTEAFGPGFGYMRGCLSWLSGVIDQSIYPVLAADYIASFDGRMEAPLPRALMVVSFTLAFSYLAYRGLDVAGRVAVGVCFACLLPFVVLCIMGLFRMDLSRARTWSDDPRTLSKGDVLGCINIFYWNLNAFDGAASFAGEVRDPGRTYPWAMLLCILLIVLSYIFPIVVGALATDIPYASWTDGTFTEVARQIGGDWLAGWVVLAAAVSNVGLFLAECSSDAFQLMGMAEVGLLPAFLGRKSRYDTPTYAILLSTVANLALALTSTFQEIVTFVNFLYSLAILFEIAAFLLLRLERPDLPRPYRVPVNMLGAVLMMLLPLAFIAVVLFTATAHTWLVSGGLAALGFLSYFVFDYLKRHQLCCAFYVTPLTPVPLSDLEELSPPGSGGGDDDDEEGDRHEEEPDGQSTRMHGGNGDHRPLAIVAAQRLVRSLSPVPAGAGGGGGGGGGPSHRADAEGGL